MSVQVLQSPLKLEAGTTMLLKINGSIKIITVVSDADGVVSFKYPCRPNDPQVHNVPKSCVYVPLSELKNEQSLNLGFSDGVVKKQFQRRANFLHANSYHFAD